MRRRDFLQVAVAGGLGAGLGVPVYLRRAWAQTPIKIGMPAALSGAYAQYGIQAKRAAELFSKDIKVKGVLGRPVEFIYEDTVGDPATAVRKAQKLVEKDGVKFLTGVALSSEALAVSAKCPEWKVIFMSTINGAGALTAKAFHRYFFRVNTSGPMGARAISLYLAEGPMKRFFALGSDYAWGRDSVASFTSQITAAKKDIVGTDYPPVGTKDFASYIAKIRQSKADGVYLALPGQDATIYLKQAHQFGLNREVKPIMEILELENMKAVGEAMVGAIGSSRYPFTVDTPRNKDFVKRLRDAQRLSRHVRRRDVRGPRVAGPGHPEGRHRRRGEGDRHVGGLDVRGPRGTVPHAQVRSPGRPARLRGGGGEGSQVSAPHPQDPRHLSGRQGDAEVSLRGLFVGRRSRLPAWRIWLNSSSTR